MIDKVIKQKTLCDGTIIPYEYKKLVQVNIDNKIEFYPVLSENDNWVQVKDGRMVVYNEDIGFPSGEYWINYFVLPPITEETNCEDKS